MSPLEEDEERWPDEPDEFDPDSLGPDPPDPTLDQEETLAKSAEISDELFRAFWASALFLNVAIAALAVGLMLRATTGTAYRRSSSEALPPSVPVGITGV